jgi:diguanylate cyclase (GGDEF)-like protein
MIWNSIILMAVIDIIMLFLIILSLSDLYRNRKLLKRLRVFSGVALVVGLFALGSLYFIDLFAMHLLPILIPSGKARTFMTNLQFNYNWVLTTSGIAILVISVLYINRVIFPRIMKLENELTIIASTDSLTKVYNRSKYSEIAEREIERAKRFKLSLSIIMFDIDNFKRVNDTYGHLTGDQVLKSLVTLVQEEIRKIDILIRWGGDEFICILPETNLEGAARLGERIRLLIAEYKFVNIGKVTLSMGISQVIEGDTEHTLLKRADEEMYKAKMNGGNQIEGKI